MKQVLLIDVMNLAFRIHYTHSDLTTKKGIPTGVLYGVMNHVLYLNHKFPKTPMIFCFDGGKTWRHEFSKKRYKSNREPSESREHIYEQVNHLFAMLNCFGFHTLWVQGTEADDLIGILAHQFPKKHEGINVLIYSGDKDYYQLVNDQVVVLKSQGGDHLRRMTAKEIQKEFQVTPKEWVKLRSLSGDSSDSIKPVKGIGKQTALKMLNAGIDASVKKFEDLPREARKAFPKLQEHWSAVRDAYVLSRLPKDHRFRRFTPEIQERVKWWIARVLKDPRRRTMKKEEYKKLQQGFLALAEKFELESLVARRHEFRNIP